MEMTVRIHNGDRMRKVQSYTKDIANRRNRPHAYYKEFTYLKIPKIMSKFGYAFKTQSKVLQEVQESFRSKCEVYFSKNRVIKLGRMDKIRRKEELAFEIKENPIITLFDRLNSRLVAPALSEAFDKISKADFGKQFD